MLTSRPAVAFGYFEALVHNGDGNRFGMEEARLRSLHPIITAAGFDMVLYEDFSDMTYELLRECANAVNEGQDAESILYEAFNDEGRQNYIITHLRVSAPLRVHPAGTKQC